jgi:hypothetical protein
MERRRRCGRERGKHQLLDLDEEAEFVCDPHDVVAGEQPAQDLVEILDTRADVWLQPFLTH